MAGKHWAKGSSRAWRRLRTQVLAQAGWRCQMQIPGVCTGHAPERGFGPPKGAKPCSHKGQVCHFCPSGHVHHIDGKEHGDDPRSLEAACRACNLHVGNPQAYAAKQPATPAVDFPDWMEALDGAEDG